MCRSFLCLSVLLCILGIILPGNLVRAQVQQEPAAAEQAAGPPQIPDEPKTVDPATLVPKKLAVAVTVEFKETPLREIAQWIQDEQKLTVLFDNRALSDEGILVGEPVTERLDDQPLYLLLNRLRSFGLAWYFEDDILHITTTQVAAERMTTEPYNVGDLFDADYTPDDLVGTIQEATSGPWQDIEGAGGALEWLGDVLFVRQTSEMHREISGLLAALRKHGRRTFTLDPPQHMRLRQKLEEPVSVRFIDTPLVQAVAELAEQAQADIRLDHPALRKGRVRDREPVSLTLADRKLSTVLHVMLADLKLTWTLQDGVLWITSADTAAKHQKTAVFDVRDLCRDENESNELTAALQTQTSGPWMAVEGVGGNIVFAKPGTMVVRHTENGLREVAELLETYRQALLASKPRPRHVIDPQEVVTRYYRMHAQIAEDLASLLPQLVRPDSWKTEQNPDAPGTAVKVASAPELLNAEGRPIHTTVAAAERGTKPDALVAPQAVLIIRQMRAAHDEIAEIIRRVEQGDPRGADGLWEGGAGGMGGFGGGFGSGFFSTP